MSDYTVSLNDERTALQSQLESFGDDKTFSSLVDRLNLSSKISKIGFEMNSILESLNIKYNLLMNISHTSLIDAQTTGSLKQQRADLYPHLLITGAVSMGIHDWQKVISVVNTGKDLQGRLVGTQQESIVANSIESSKAAVTNFAARPITLESILSSKSTLIKDGLPVLPVEQRILQKADDNKK